MSEFAMLFPGQGSQSPGMLSQLADRHEQVRGTFEEASAALEFDLWKVVSEGPEERLNLTEITQPAILTAAIAIWRIWRDQGGAMPARMAGHSLGEYTALVAAGSLQFSDAVRIVAERGRQMQAAVPAGTGAMAAVLGLDDEVVEAICREVAEDQVVAPANYNSPGQVVVAGHAAAVERAMHKCSEAGARRAVILPVSVPSHSPLMQPAADAMAGVLAGVEIRSPEVPIIHNCDVAEHAAPDEIRASLIEQLCSPVRWTESVRAMTGAGIMCFLECGPGKVLSGLGRRIERAAQWLALEQPETLEQAIADWRND